MGNPANGPAAAITITAWQELLGGLISDVAAWAEDLGWSTRRVEKKIEEEDGDYRAPALLLQRDAVRLFLEPISRSAPGADGLVDLYRMPAYDDVASLYHSEGRWNIHRVDSALFEAEASPFTKETCGEILEEIGTR